LEQDITEGENPVCVVRFVLYVMCKCRCTNLPGQGERPYYETRFGESGCLGMQPKKGGKFHPRLNIDTRPIADKYREGKMKSTLKKELNST